MPTSKTPKTKTPAKKSSTSRPAAKKKRSYNSPLREQQIAETKERIIVAGIELVRSYDSLDWKNLNATAVAKQSGLGKRTVQHYYPTERVLRDAVLQRLVIESGVRFDTLKVGELGDTMEQIFRYLQSFAMTRSYPYDPTVQTLDQQARIMLVKAVSEAKPKWTESQHKAAAAVLDMFWQPPMLERLTSAWDMDVDQAVTIVKWLVDTVENAIQKNKFPELPADKT